MSSANKHNSLLDAFQQELESIYGARTGLNLSEFVRPLKNFKALGELLISQDMPGPDVEIAVLLDRDILAAWEQGTRPRTHRPMSVAFEEISHFVYFCFNHLRGRSVTALEMELQSEVDRILLAYHSAHLDLGSDSKKIFLSELLHKPYETHRTYPATYEEARVWASKLVVKLNGGKPEAWSAKEQSFLRKFFHSDLSAKLRLIGEL